MEGTQHDSLTQLATEDFKVKKYTLLSFGLTFLLYRQAYFCIFASGYMLVTLQLHPEQTI